MRRFALSCVLFLAFVAIAAASKSAPQWVTSSDNQHRWMISDGRQWVGFHNDQLGVWIDLRSQSATGFPEFVVIVPKDGGHACLQVCETGKEPVTVDLVRAAHLINRLLREETE